MQPMLNRLGRFGAAAFMAFALAAIAQGAFCVALSNPPMAAGAAGAQA